MYDDLLACIFALMVGLQGKAAREKSLQVLKQSLEDIYLPRGRQWLMLFPEGGYLRNMKPGSIK